jgi:hypothetical protein
MHFTRACYYVNKTNLIEKNKNTKKEQTPKHTSYGTYEIKQTKKMEVFF